MESQTLWHKARSGQRRTDTDLLAGIGKSPIHLGEALANEIAGVVCSGLTASGKRTELITQYDEFGGTSRCHSSDDHLADFALHHTGQIFEADTRHAILRHRRILRARRSAVLPRLGMTDRKFREHSTSQHSKLDPAAEGVRSCEQCTPRRYRLCWNVLP